MKFFTLELLRRENGEAAWEGALASYEAHLQAIRAKLLPSLHDLLDHYCLHDAQVLAAGGNDKEGTFFIAVQFDSTPEGAQLTFRLAAPPKYLPSNIKAMPTRWAYEEVDLVAVAGIERFRMSILFSDDAELQLTFSEFGLSRFHTLAPVTPAAAEAGLLVRDRAPRILDPPGLTDKAT